MNLTLKPVLVISGIVLSVVGILLKTWQVAVVGNSIALAAILFT